MTGAGVEELLHEFQGYVLAYRLRRAVGGRVAPRGRALTLGEYARKRLERQQLARDLVGGGLHPRQLGHLDRLSDELMFGFWLNPREVAAFLKGAGLNAAGLTGTGLTGMGWGTPHPALGDSAAFAALLSNNERARLGDLGVRLVVAHHLTCLTLGAPLLDPNDTERVWQRIEATRPPLFVDEVMQGREDEGA